MKTLKRDKVILNFRESKREKEGYLTGAYPHLVEDKIYWSLYEPLELGYAIKEGDTFIKAKNDIPLFSGTLAPFNFRAFIDTNPDTPEDEKYKAVGGYHVGRQSMKTGGYGFKISIDNDGTPQRVPKDSIEDNPRNFDLHPLVKDCPITKELDIVKQLDRIWPCETKLLFTDDAYSPKFANGLYVFKSEDGISWELYHDKPVLSSFTEVDGLVSGDSPCKGIIDIDEKFNVGVDFDTMPSIFYDNNKNEYKIYLRYNVSLGVRHVFFASSKDLINWSKPKVVEFDPPSFFDCSWSSDLTRSINLYFMSAFLYPNSNKYIAFIPTFLNEIKNTHDINNVEYTDEWNKRSDTMNINRYFSEAKTDIMISDDGVKWKKIDEIFYGGELLQLQNQSHVVSFEEEEKKYILYVNEGWKTQECKLVKYTIDKEELDKMVLI